MDNERGVTILETAVVLPVFFLLLFGLFEFGLVFSAYHTMVGAAREGARYAVTPNPFDTTNPYSLPTNSQVAAKVCDKVSAGVFGTGQITACNGGSPATLSTGACPSASGSQPTVSSENIYLGQCTVAVPLPYTCKGTSSCGIETYEQVAVHRTVQLFWGWKIPLTATAVMRSEGN
ncbi:MAG TPA: TadE/TadG family type IV pilus assembly protein [Terriglobales bacterium]|jgi:Flp pilus assembly protein TadG|nr:TadE/TadG family type IV pilus assembly protein [Terriglobales bacterium]